MKLRTLGITIFAIISLFSQPIYANECQATITSTPSDADVYVDGKLIGQSPTTYLVGSPFSATITVEKEGYETWTTNIVVSLSEHKQVNAVLTPLQVPQRPTNTTTSSTTSTSTSTSSSATLIVTSNSTEEEYSTLPYVAAGLTIVIIATILLYTKKIKSKQ